MIISKGINDDGDLIPIDGVHDHVSSELKRHIRCMTLLNAIREITDPAKLPEYLSDEDPRVLEEAKLKLNELTESDVRRSNRRAVN